MRRRILLAILLTVLITTCALGIPLGYTALQIVESINRENLAVTTQTLGAGIDDDVAAGREVNWQEVQRRLPTGGRVTLRFPDRPDRTYGAELGPDTLTEEVPIVQHGRVIVSIDAAPTRTWQTQVAALVALIVVLTVVVGTVVAMVTARRLTKPLRHVVDRATRLGAGDFRPDHTRYDLHELDLVAEALDESATALAQLVQRERDLVGDVSHQLRSRLTALQLRLEALTAVPDQDIAAEAAEALHQAERLADVLDELLTAAREARAVGAEPVDLAEELTTIAEEWRELLRSEGRTLRLRLNSGLFAKVTPARLREAIGVLLDNALRHGGGTVTLSARVGEGALADTLLVEVTDAGTGVPDELAPHIFERGVSGAGSTGLGLALARALIDSDGGRLELSVARPATFTVFLPVPKAGNVRGVRWPTERTRSPR